MGFDQLDFLYTPCKDVAAATEYFESVLGARVIFAIEEMGTRVAMIELADGPPYIIFAGHLEGDRPVLVYRVSNLKEAFERMETKKLQEVRSIEIPQGPCRSFRTPDGQRIAIYELTRPQVEGHFHGRRDF